MAEIEIGDVVRARASAGGFHAVVRGIRLGRLQVERCDGQPSGPLAASDVAAVFKPAGAPAGKPRGERMRPTAQMKLL